MSKYENYHRKKPKLSESFPARIWLKIITKFPFLNRKLSIVMKLPAKAKVLDVGCGRCSFLKLVHKVRPDLKLFGVDVVQVDDIPEFVEFKRSKGEKLPFRENMFDYVISQHVIEHVENPREIVSEMVRVCKDYVVVVAPNYKKTFLWDSNNFWSDYTHVRPFTKISMKNLLESCGLHNARARNTRDLNVPLIFLPLLLIYSLFSRKLGFTNVCANFVKLTTVGIARKGNN